MQTSALLGAKIGFFKIYVVFARTRREGVEPVRTFFRQEGQGICNTLDRKMTSFRQSENIIAL